MIELTSRYAKKYRFRRIVGGVSSDEPGEPEEIVQRHLWQIIGHLFPKSVVSGMSLRNASLRPLRRIYLQHPGYLRHRSDIPGIFVLREQGKGPVEGDEYKHGLYFASRARMWLDLLAPRRRYDRRYDIDVALNDMAQVDDPDGLLDEARRLAAQLDCPESLKRLEGLIDRYQGVPKQPGHDPWVWYPPPRAEARTF